jgi:glycosyltransferase involved in cell wall biosynthesis
MVKRLDAIFFISEQGRSYFENYFPANENFKISHLGVQKQLEISDINVEKARNKFTIVSNSWVQPLKRIDLLVHALGLIPSEYEIEWFHIGDWHKSEETYNYVMKYAKELLGPKPNITYKFMGCLTPQEIFNFYRTGSIHLFINLSSTEGVPVSIMEAEAFGIPIIATNVGGVSEIVSDQVGFLLEPNPTPEQICKKIISIMQLSPEGYFTLRKNAYNKWNSDFNAEKNYTSFVERVFHL